MRQFCRPGVYCRCILTRLKARSRRFIFDPKVSNKVSGHRRYVRDLFFVWDLALVMLGDVWAKDGSEWV